MHAKDNGKKNSGPLKDLHQFYCTELAGLATFITVAASNYLIKVRQVEQRYSTKHAHRKHLQTAPMTKHTTTSEYQLSIHTVTNDVSFRPRILENWQVRESRHQVFPNVQGFVQGFALVPAGGVVANLPKKTSFLL